jgi:hypothetical protein
MASPLNVAKLKSTILRPALTSHYTVSILPTESTLNYIQSNSGTSYDNELVEISCTEASLPGSTIATLDIMNDYVGISEKHGYRRLYDDRADFTFYVNHEYSQIRFFESWMKYIVNEQFSAGIDKRTFTSRSIYPNQYCTDGLTITKFEKDDLNKLQYKFIKAFPISINSIPVSYESSNLLKVTVSFTYSRYYINRFSVAKEQELEKIPDPNANPNTNIPPIADIPGTTTVTNEYYNNFGRREQDATNTANFFGVA